jgi:hypothetical protein
VGYLRGVYRRFRDWLVVASSPLLIVGLAIDGDWTAVAAVILGGLVLTMVLVLWPRGDVG